MKKYVVETFESIDQMLRVFNTREPNQSFKGRHMTSMDTGDADWLGTETYEDAVDLIRHGWEDPLPQLKDAAKAAGINTNTSTNKLRPRNSVVGYAPHIPNAIMGLPESMIATERVPTKVKAVTIVYSSDCNASVSTEKFLKAGVVALKIVNDLELKGYRVRLINEFTCANCGDEVLEGRVVLKDWRQPIDLKKLAFPLAHVSMTRRFSFRQTELCPDIKSWSGSYGGAYGNTTDYDDMVKDLRKANVLKENEYYINLRLIWDCNHNADEVMKRAGITLK